jgi:hypothetical protein
MPCGTIFNVLLVNVHVVVRNHFDYAHGNLIQMNLLNGVA